jgi:hypothetical protein
MIFSSLTTLPVPVSSSFLPHVVTSAHTTDVYYKLSCFSCLKSYSWLQWCICISEYRTGMVLSKSHWCITPYIKTLQDSICIKLISFNLKVYSCNFCSQVRSVGERWETCIYQQTQID